VLTEAHIAAISQEAIPFIPPTQFNVSTAFIFLTFATSTILETVGSSCY